MTLTVALFSHYEDAVHAVERLARAPRPFEALSVIVKQRTAIQFVARTEQQRDRGAISGGAHDNLNAILLGRMPVELPQVGAAIAVGPLATALRRSRLALKTVLQKAGLSEHDAQACRDGLRTGKVLIAIHKRDRESHMSETTLERILDETDGQLVNEVNCECELPSGRQTS